MAVEAVTGAQPVWFCEWDDAPSKVLAHHWPGVPNHRDVTLIDWDTMPRVDILTGGYPCQPFSHAGRRKGEHDERHLWPYVRGAIRALRPRFAFLENVAGHLTLGFDTVLREMAEDGADVWWTCVRASDAGAPHHRDRLFILIIPADPNGFGLETGRSPRRQNAEVAGDNNGECALPGVGGWEQLHSECSMTWEQIVGRRGPEPTETVDVRVLPNTDWEKYGYEFPPPEMWVEKQTLNPTYVEWMMGLPEGHVTGVPGLFRADQLKMIGNGVCPQQGALALRELLEMVNA